MGLLNLLNAGMPPNHRMSARAWQQWFALKRWISECVLQYRLERRDVDDGEWCGPELGGES